MSRNRRIKRSAPAVAAKKPKAVAKQNARSSAQGTERPRESGRSREIVGVIGLGTAIFALTALVSFQAGGMLMGPFGRTIALVFYGFAGLCGYVLAGLIALISVRLLMDRAPLLRSREGAGLGLGMVSLTTLMHLIAGDYRVDGHAPGGLVGEHIAEVFRAIIFTPGTALLALTGLAVAVVIATPLRMRQLLEYLGMGARFCWAGIARTGAAAGHACGEVIRAVLPERERDEYLDDDYDDEDEVEEYDAYALEESEQAAYDPPIIEGSSAHKAAVPQAEIADVTERIDEDELATRLATMLAEDEAQAGAAAAAAADAQAGSQAAAKKRARKSAAAAEPVDATVPVALPAPMAAPTAIDDSEVVAELDDIDEADDIAPAAATASVTSEAARKPARKPVAVVVDDVPPAQAAAAADAGKAPVIVESKFMAPEAKDIREKEKKVEAERLDFIPLGQGEYKLPPINLLDYDESQRVSIDRESMLELSARLTKTLDDYGVKGEVVAIRPGPVVTMYEFAPAPGTRINKIVNLSDDLAMTLEALSVRIVAPIPGKAAVGIEVPNRTRETVYLKEIIADETFHQGGKRKLPLAMGKDIEGAPSVVDLAKMPHLLVAGTTGSGKSVCINSMITSLLYSCTPEDVRMIMVDPKMLELSIYEGIPHLLLPVVTDPKKANLALRWAVEEMERRYDLMANMGVRDLGGYNKKVEKLKAQYEADKLRRAADAAQRLADDEDDGEVVEITEERAIMPALEEPPQHLPYIVVIIDEFADLMMCAPKEVETSVARIAQKARAAGIHLILATQRPSVDVITGLIKANFPSRTAFRVASKVDSRTILDQSGAEALLGSGDMLFSDRGAAPCRYHGCYVGEEEIGRVVDFLKTQGKPVYNLDILKPRDEDGEDGDSGDAVGSEELDEMYDRAVSLVSETRQVSISMIQRRLRVGYNRAARMVEIMEKQGVVTPPDHTNKREVLIQPAA